MISSPIIFSSTAERSEGPTSGWTALRFPSVVKTQRCFFVDAELYLCRPAASPIHPDKESSSGACAVAASSADHLLPDQSMDRPLTRSHAWVANGD
jgi:hypothetical protein